MEGEVTKMNAKKRRPLKRKRREEKAAKENPVVEKEEEKSTTNNEDMTGGAENLHCKVTEKTNTNKQRCLIVGSRSMTSKDRHLLLDLRGLIPHSREHSKLETRDNLGDMVAELCSLHSCNSVMLVEARKMDTSYLWMAQAPSGPSVKMLLHNVHTADELRLVGNCLKFSRPLLHFDKEFEMIPQLRIMKALLQMVFNTPRYHPKSKPFVDHMLCFFYLDGNIWVRHYQLAEDRELELVEIGPRFTMEPVCILNGCMRGNVLWKNALVEAPSAVRRSRKEFKLEKAQHNEEIQKLGERHREANPKPEPDPLANVFQ